jgi:hypothetical protein
MGIKLIQDLNLQNIYAGEFTSSYNYTSLLSSGKQDGSAIHKKMKTTLRMAHRQRLDYTYFRTLAKLKHG